MASLIESVKSKFTKSSLSHEVGRLKVSNYLNGFSDAQLKDLLSFAESTRLTELIPNLAGKKVLYVGLTAQPHLQEVQELGPGQLVYYQVGETLSPQTGDIPFVRGLIRPFAVKKGVFDLIIFPAAVDFKHSVLDAIDAIAKTLVNGARLIVSTIHPQFEFLLLNQNPKSTARATHSFEGYFRQFQEMGLFVEDILECSVGKELKPFFTLSSEQDYFEEFKGLPLVISFRAIKYSKNP